MSKHKTLGLYEFKDEYQVIDYKNIFRCNVQFQGTKEECKKYIEINK